MTGAMYAGIAGLKTHMQNLNVIGNNIANINTPGYKAGRSVFRSALYTQISSGREGTTVMGSKNPSQIGYGSTLSNVDIDMSTANYNPGKPTDCMIDGDAFFLIGDKTTANLVDPRDPSKLKSFTLTRVGDFEPKSDGYLANGKGDVVYGFLCIGKTDEGDPIYSDQLVPIRVPRQAEDGTILYPSYQTVDSEGNPVDTENGGADDTETKLALRDTIYDPRTAEDGGDADQTSRQECLPASLTNLSISETGKITATVRSTGEQITIGAIALGTVDNPNGVTQLSNTYYKCGEGAGNLAVNMIGGLSETVIVANGNLPADYYSANRTSVITKPTEGQNEVQIEGGDGDGTTLRLGMGYINESQAPGGDEGDETAGLPYGSQVFDTGSSTKLVVGGLESSSTDLAKEIADMITTQRGYQANTRVITVTDSMLEELVNMKR